MKVSARCTCGRVIKVDGAQESLWFVLQTLHPELKDRSQPKDEHLVAILAARHELAKGRRHKVTLQVTIEFDDVSPSTGKAT